ncbi:MAG: FAD:protein FMN transferase [Eubacterium sp.]|nr:FAD:protein FMN transferase [Eubacterium sp.]
MVTRNKSIKFILTVFLVLCIIISQTACSKKSNPTQNIDPVQKGGFYLDTVCNITIYQMDKMSESSANEVIDGAFKLCEKYENLLSKTRESSDVYKVNHAGGKAVECDDETVLIIRKAIEYAKLSEGKFDVTIGQATDLWNFQPEGGEGKIPEQSALNEALKHVDYRQIQIDGKMISLSDPKGEIDLGGIAKGYIADKVSEYLKKKGVKGAVVDLGGNISVIGYKADETEFRIGIRNPFGEAGSIIGAINAHDKSLVTSGTYERSFKFDGKLYHHILDVKTGYPVETDLASVTIIGAGNAGIDCDSLATTCLVLGEEKAKALIESLDGFEAIFVQNDGTITTSKDLKGFEATK